jgi:splicing factor 3B subunit 5
MVRAFPSMRYAEILTSLKQADKLRTQQELERLQAKYIGTGHPDTTSWEWKTNIHRDTYASMVGHPPLLSYMALAQNEPVAKIRAQLIRVGFLPCQGAL